MGESERARGATPQSGTRRDPAAEILYPTLLCGQEEIFRAKKSPAAQIQSLYPTGAQRKDRNPDMMIQNQLSYIRRPSSNVQWRGLRNLAGRR
jgi:hypothetical protein